jgi:hypothetical protein
MKRKQTDDKARTREQRAMVPASVAGYGRLVADISGLLERARRSAARAINGILTATYWEIGRRTVEFEQGGKSRATYGERLLAHLSKDLTAKHGRGFSERNLEQMRNFYLGWVISQTPSAKLEARAKCPTLPGESDIVTILQRVMDIIDPPVLPDPPRRRIGFGVR